MNSIVMQGYSRQTGAMFENNIRNQINLSGLRMGDPDVESVLMQHIYAMLPSDLQVGCGATTVEGMLKFLESISERYKSTNEITIALKKEAQYTNPAMMWSKFKTLLRNIKPNYSIEQIDEEAWEAVRDAVYVDTPYQPFISGMLEMPTEAQLEVAVSQWKSTMENVSGEERVRSFLN